MSGHSKWSKIKRKKGVADVKKGKIFSQLSKAVTLAAKSGGGDMSMNPTLKLAVEKAKQANMPLDNIDKAIKKGTDGLEGGAIEEVLYEAYAPGGIALMIEGTTDNTNRTVAEIKHILSKNGGRFGEAGSVKWMFEHFGYLEIEKKETELSNDDIEILIIESGADDFKSIDNTIVVYTKPEDLYKVKENLEKNNLKISDAGLEWRAKNTIKIDDEKINARIEKLLEALDEQEDVGEVFSNLEE
ncbi:MAG: YebC/PmpR family DNA-binding transcriptional regulator [Patescibacteria group bacterium]|nr:YebC/PmpR family DNA-binding transcriptional regulator [Patescibacteria group bacterium]